MHNTQEDTIVEDMSKRILRIYVSLENKQEDYQFHMIEVEGKIDSQHIDIFIDYGAIHSYIDLYMTERFKLKRYKHEKSWLVQLATRTKRKINEHSFQTKFIQ
jgi:hypothetical protein